MTDNCLHEEGQLQEEGYRSHCTVQVLLPLTTDEAVLFFILFVFCTSRRYETGFDRGSICQGCS